MWEHIKRHYQWAHEFAYEWDAEGRTCEYSEMRYRARYWYATASIASNLIALALCRTFDHKLHSDSHAGPDSGSDSIFCSRCGWSHDVTYY